MGTHPIFESDFDCLTENKMLALRAATFYPRTRVNQMSHLVRRNATKVTKELDSKSVARWLYVCAGGAVVTVCLGGATRLTESGLSMTTWDLIKDIRRPQNEAEWQREFDRYKTFPEYEEVHGDMTLSGFKFIYHMEWGHRNAGRTGGGLFLAPFIYFAARGRLSPRTLKRCFGIGCLLGFQGGLGWYMVKSGLEKAYLHVAAPVAAYAPAPVAAYAAAPAYPYAAAHALPAQYAAAPAYTGYNFGYAPSAYPSAYAAYPYAHGLGLPVLAAAPAKAE